MLAVQVFKEQQKEAARQPVQEKPKEVDDDPRGGYLQFANWHKKAKREREASPEKVLHDGHHHTNKHDNKGGSPRRYLNDSQNSGVLRDQTQFGSQVRSPKAYKIKRQLR